MPKIWKLICYFVLMPLAALFKKMVHKINLFLKYLVTGMFDFNIYCDKVIAYFYKFSIFIRSVKNERVIDMSTWHYLKNRFFACQNAFLKPKLLISKWHCLPKTIQPIQRKKYNSVFVFLLRNYIFRDVSHP